VLFVIFGLGKKRTKFGLFIDQEEIKQIELEELTGLSRGTISKLCNDKSYRPKLETVMKIKNALKLIDKNMPDDYFGM
jgi:transcriptional regulator with XRE-family HTH domain